MIYLIYYMMIEQIKYGNDKLQTTKYQKEWTEKSPNSKLKDINSKLESIRNKTSEIKNLQNLIKNREYREFQKVIGCSPYDGMLGINSLRFTGNFIEKSLKTNSVINHTKQKFNDFKFDVGIIQNSFDTINIQRHEQEYLAQHETMLESNYNKLFSGKEKIRQGQLGDCYLVSGIIELSNAQHFNTLMRTSIQRMKWGNGDLGYQIKIPFGEPSGRKILIKDKELKVAKINGSDGFKLLELAYAKNKLRPNNKSGNKYKPISTGELNVTKDAAGNIKYITVLNPWNTQGQGKNYQNFTLDEFYKGFSCIQQGKINTNRFLDNK